MRRILFILALSLVTAACSLRLAEDITPPPGAEQAPISQTQPAQVSGPLYPLVPPNSENGGAIYVEKCAPCHGTSGKGDGPQAAQLPNPVAAIGTADVARQASPAQWYTQVTQGNLERFMPPFASLSDRERWDVVAYAFSLSASQAEIENAASLYQENCAGCHGERGAGDGPQAAGLSVPPPDLTNQEFTAQRSEVDFYQAISAGVSPEMPAYADQLSEDERWALAAYLRMIAFQGSSAPVASAGTPVLTETPGTKPGAAQATPAEGESVGGTPGVEGTQIASGNNVEAVQAAGQISGNVVNASGGEVPSGLQLTLRGYDDMVQVITQTTTLGDDGSYTFENVGMPAGRAFMVTLDYDNSTYGSDIAIAQADVPRLELPVTIYETTTDTSLLSADRLHLFFEFVDDKTLRVIELYILSNSGNKTLVPDAEGKPIVNVVLPEGAQNLEFQDGVLGERYIKTDNGFGDTASIPPGTGSYELLFSFEMPFDRKLELDQPVSLPVNAVVVLVPDNGVKVIGDTLVDGGTRDVQGAQYRLYNGSALSAGSDLQMTISGRPSSSTPSLLTSSSTTNLAIGLGVFGVALILAGVLLYRRSRSTDVDEEQEHLLAPAPEAGPESVESLMDAIIALDDLYQEGQLPESAYLERRAKLKERLQVQMDGDSRADGN